MERQSPSRNQKNSSSSSRRMDLMLLKQVSQSPVVVRFLREIDSHGWALISICDTTGLVSIVSDWGNANFVWQPTQVGNQTVTEFFVGAEANYIATKFSYDNKDLSAKVVDVDATKKQLKNLNTGASNKAIAEFADHLEN